MCLSLEDVDSTQLFDFATQLKNFDKERELNLASHASIKVIMTEQKRNAFLEKMAKEKREKFRS